MSVTWNLGFHFPSNGQIAGFTVLQDVLADGIQSSATTTQYVLKDGSSNQATFHGNFVVSGMTIQSGTITGFDAYHGSAASLIHATGYAIDFNTFIVALVKYKVDNRIPMFHLLFDQPMTVTGSDVALFGDPVPGGFADDHLLGRAGGDLIFDLGGSDLIEGGPGNDSITGDFNLFGGVEGNDTIYGGDGDDDIKGAGGDDWISGGPGADLINGGDGTDTADYSEKSDALNVKLDGPNPVAMMVAGFAEDTLSEIENINGGSGNDKLKGDGYANNLAGNGGKDGLKGKDGDDVLIGLNGNDKLVGGKDDDILSGGKGHDDLKGSGSPDLFVFDVKPKLKHRDKILDFSGKDKIGLDADVFTKLNDSGKLKGKFFVDGPAAKDGNDYVLYHDGVLSYDRDGMGGAKAIPIAELKGHPDLSAGDLIMV